MCCDVKHLGAISTIQHTGTSGRECKGLQPWIQGIAGTLVAALHDLVAFPPSSADISALPCSITVADSSGGCGSFYKIAIIASEFE